MTPRIWLHLKKDQGVEELMAPLMVVALLVRVHHWTGDLCPGCYLHCHHRKNHPQGISCLLETTSLWFWYWRPGEVDAQRFESEDGMVEVSGVSADIWDETHIVCS